MSKNQQSVCLIAKKLANFIRKEVRQLIPNPNCHCVSTSYFINDVNHKIFCLSEIREDRRPKDWIQASIENKYSSPYPILRFSFPYRHRSGWVNSVLDDLEKRIDEALKWQVSFETEQTMKCIKKLNKEDAKGLERELHLIKNLIQ